VAGFSPGAEIDGRYRIVDRLASGGMGVVFRAEDIVLGRAVALKVADPTLGNDPAAANNFLQEARSLAQIRHDNVVQVYAFGVHQGLYYFAMEFVEGEPLDAIVDRHATATTVELDRALEILRAVGGGLGAVHARNLVHRDVKPANIVIEAHGRPVLVDFGLARGKTRSNPRMTTTAGTPAYMAPEQARDVDGTLTTAASDLYAFACTAFELLTGRAVFEGADVYEVLLAHFRQAPPRVSEYRPPLAVFDPIFARALAKAPEYRHESVAAFLGEIDVAARQFARTSVSKRPPRMSMPDASRVFVLESDGAIARRLTGAIDRALDTPVIEFFAKALDLIEAFIVSPPHVVVLDEESLSTPLPMLAADLRNLPGGANVEIVALRRNWDGAAAGGLAPLGVREIPKPFNLLVVESVLRKAGARAAAR
jgi:eukaryotic-like serine/threonine-protein kinase